MAITRDEVVSAALVILDEYGLPDLSMRRVAHQLEVQPGALYHHVANKQTLLGRVADRILAPVTCPPAPWREAIQGWALSLRDALMAHRDSADLVASVRAYGLLSVDIISEPILVLAAAGLPPDTARSAAGTLLHFILGHVAEEQTRREWERLTTTDSADAAQPVRDDRERFDTGVDLLLDGTELRMSTASPVNSPSSPSPG